MDCKTLFYLSLLLCFLCCVRSIDINHLVDETQERCGQRCAANAYCLQADNVWSCKCLPGYKGNGLSHCEDIDECALNRENPRYPPTYPCLQCKNLPGHYICDSSEEYFFLKEPITLDISQNHAHEWKEPGYILKSIRPNSTVQVSTISLANKPPGRYEITYEVRVNGRNPDPETFPILTRTINILPSSDTCTNRCQRRYEYCVVDVNAVDGYRCECTTGYKRDKNSQSCVDINECLLSSTNNCFENSCINTEGSFYCRCPPTYTGDGRVCTPIQVIPPPVVPKPPNNYWKLKGPNPLYLQQCQRYIEHSVQPEDGSFVASYIEDSIIRQLPEELKSDLLYFNGNFIVNYTIPGSRTELSDAPQKLTRRIVVTPVNRCELSRDHLCAHKCISPATCVYDPWLPSSYKCKCGTGYALDQSGFSCFYADIHRDL